MAAVIQRSPATVATTPLQLPDLNFRSVTIKSTGSDLYIKTDGTTPSATNHDYILATGEAVEIMADQVKKSSDIILVSATSSTVIWKL
jgi:hypothetical protein